MQVNTETISHFVFAQIWNYNTKNSDGWKSVSAAVLTINREQISVKLERILLSVDAMASEREAFFLWFG